MSLVATFMPSHGIFTELHAHFPSSRNLRSLFGIERSMLRCLAANLVSAVTFLLLPCCAADKNGSDELLPGRAVYQEPLTDGNTFACSTCHALSEPTSNGIRRPGHPIGDATRRSHWKNGRAASFLEATNSCVSEWMGAPAWTETEPRFLALRDFLEAEAGTRAAADLSFAIVDPPENLAEGDPERGRALFDAISHRNSTDQVVLGSVIFARALSNSAGTRPTQGHEQKAGASPARVTRSARDLARRLWSRFGAARPERQRGARE
jgi:hypothetical protein